MNKIGFNNANAADKMRYSPEDVFAAGMRNFQIANTAYPINHNVTMRNYRIGNDEKHRFAEKVWDGVDSLGLYVHVPFCEKRCSFCEYTVIDPEGNQDNEERYFTALMKEFALYKDKTDLRGKKLIGFDIGGGTPSLPDAKYIGNVICAADNVFNVPSDIDISIETTPKIAAENLTKMRDYKMMGINRISMGVQTITDSVLRISGRMHTSLDWNRQAAANIRSAGFEKFNVDIMYGLVGQTVDNIKATIKHVLELDPEFITIYRTRYKGTRMAELGSQITQNEINEQQKAIKEIITSAGFAGAIGKNTFSKIEGNLGTSDYLTERVVNGTEYLGMGLGAQSFSVRSLSYNSGAASKRMDEYYKDLKDGNLPIQDIYHLPLEVAIGKFISVSFYFGGINLKSFYANFGAGIEEFFSEEIGFLKMKGYMKEESDYLNLTQEGLDNLSGVISLFYQPSIKDYLINKK